MPKTKRCEMCRKKDFMNMKCKCGMVVCQTHMHTHNCQFDYSAAHKRTLEKDNPLIQFAKMEKV